MSLQEDRGGKRAADAGQLAVAAANPASPAKCHLLELSMEQLQVIVGAGMFSAFDVARLCSTCRMLYDRKAELYRVLPDQEKERLLPSKAFVEPGPDWKLFGQMEGRQLWTDEACQMAAGLVEQGVFSLGFLVQHLGAAIKVAARKSHYGFQRAVFDYMVRTKGITLEQARTDGSLLLRWACKNGDLEGVKKLVEEVGIRPADAVPDTNVESIVAEQFEDLPPVVLSFLSQTFLAIADRDLSADTEALVLACMHGHLDVCKYLVDNDFQAASANEYKGILAALREASTNGHLEIVQHLMHTFSLSCIDLLEDGYVAFSKACSGGHLNVVTFFTENHNPVAEADMFEVCLESLTTACRHGHIDIVKYLVDAYDIEASDIDRSMCVRMACASGSLDLVTFVVEKFDISRQDILDSDDSVLAEACSAGNLNVIKYLFEKLQLTAADARLGDNEPLSTACEKGHVDIVKYLMEEVGLTRNDARASGNYAVGAAVSQGHIDVVRYLFEKGGVTVNDTLQVDMHDGDAIGMACRHGYLNILRYLVEE